MSISVDILTPMIDTDGGVSRVLDKMFSIVEGPEVRFRGERLQEIRESRGISRQELAAKAGLSRAYIYLLEGRLDDDDDTQRRPSYDVVRRLARALSVEPDAFSADGPAKCRMDLDIPPSLSEAAKRFSIPAGDVRELAALSFRGRQPAKAGDWAQLWIAILNSIDAELPK